MSEVDRVVLHYADGSSQVFVPETAPPPEPEPEPEPDPDLISWGFTVTPDAPNRDFFIAPGWRVFELDMVWTAGPERSAYKRTQIFGLTEYGGPSKPWVNRRLIAYLVQSGRSTWKFRHGFPPLKQDKKLTSSGRLQVDPGDAFRVTARVDLTLGICKATVLPLQGNQLSPLLNIDAPIQTDLDFPAILRIGEPGPEGDQGPWVGATYEGWMRIFR